MKIEQEIEQEIPQLRRRARIGPLLGLALALAFPLAATASRSAEPAQAGRPLVVKIHADWCGACQLLGPTWERVERELGAEAELVVLDVTDRAAVARSEARAAQLGIGDFFRRYRDRLGTIAVLHASSREPVEVFNGELNYVSYVDAVKRAR